MTTVTRPALLSSVAYIMQAAGITLADLAQHMGQPLPAMDGIDIDAVHRKPSPNKGRPSPMKGKRKPVSPQALRLLEIADCEEGATIPDFCAGLGVNDSTVHHHLKRLSDDRLITRVKIPGQASPVYFARPAHAAAFAEANAPKSAPTPEPARVALSEAEAKTLQTNAKKRAAAKKSAPPLGARNLTPNANGNPTFMPPRIDGSRPRPSGEAVETEATRRTIDSTQRPTARWQAQQLPADPRWPSFSGTPLGVNPDTGRPWA